MGLLLMQTAAILIFLVLPCLLILRVTGASEWLGTAWMFLYGLRDREQQELVILQWKLSFLMYLGRQIGQTEIRLGEIEGRDSG
jgi:hypothetical protein